MGVVELAMSAIRFNENTYSDEYRVLRVLSSAPQHASLFQKKIDLMQNYSSAVIFPEQLHAGKLYGVKIDSIDSQTSGVISCKLTGLYFSCDQTLAIIDYLMPSYVSSLDEMVAYESKIDEAYQFNAYSNTHVNTHKLESWWVTFLFYSKKDACNWASKIFSHASG